MKQTNLFLLLMLALVVSFSSCKDEPFATVTITPLGSTADGDLNGDGGTASKIYTWNNPQNIANYDMDITASSGGTFQLIVKDADGMQVLNETLVANQAPDSKSGLTLEGAIGDWTIEVYVTNFKGDGSFNLTPGT